MAETICRFAQHRWMLLLLTPSGVPLQVETNIFVGSNFTDAQGDWLSKPNAALYISKPGPLASSDTIIVLTLKAPAFNESAGTLTYKVGGHLIYFQWSILMHHRHMYKRVDKSFLAHLFKTLQTGCAKAFVEWLIWRSGCTSPPAG
jgi:hypothetical protein